MESLAHLVAESLLRHGLEPAFDHRRLQWSNWFRCEDSFSLVLAPCKPGLFALGEEVISPGELAVGDGKRMLALFQISEASDLGMALGRLFLSGSPARERFASGRCFARYVVIEDPIQRRTALSALQRWMASSAVAVSGVQPAIVDGAQVPSVDHLTRDTDVAPDALVRGAEHSSAGFAQEAGFGASEREFRHAAAPAIAAALDADSAAAADASEQRLESSNKQAQIGPPMLFPSGF